MKWVDVRDVWPIFFDGSIGVRLPKVSRDVDLAHAERHATALVEGKRCYVCEPVGALVEDMRQA